MLDLTKLLVLAPMAGYSDPPMRELVRRFGADFTVSEMISINALAYKNEKTLNMLKSSTQPFFVQLCGSDLELFKKAVLFLNNYDLAGIDLNCGCPVNKVVKQGAGSFLLKQKDKMKRILELIKKYNKHKYTSVKIRLGFDSFDHLDLAKVCEEAGVDFIAVHARTRKELYSGKAHFEALKELKLHIKIPIIANGDINLENADFVKKYTGINSLMIGRAAIGRPWIFKELRGQNVDEAVKLELILAHFEELEKHYKNRAIFIFRKHLHEYSKGYDGASSFRTIINKINDPKLVLKTTQEFFSIK